MNKHTPGPWTCSIDECATVRDARDNQLAIMTYLHTRTGGRRHGDEVAANARLIAAAPELLDMLERAVRRLEIAHANGDSIMREWIVDARAVIAKAKGEAK